AVGRRPAEPVPGEPEPLHVAHRAGELGVEHGELRAGELREPVGDRDHGADPPQQAGRARRRGGGAAHVPRRVAMSRRTVWRLPLIFVARSAAITLSTISSGSSTSEKRSLISIVPMSLASRRASLAIAPTRSAGRMLSLRPEPM